MCLAIPGEIVHLDADRPDVAIVEVSGVRRPVNVSLIRDEGVRRGDWVLVHVGFAMTKIDETEAQAVLELLERIGQAYQDDLDAFAETSADT